MNGDICVEKGCANDKATLEGQLLSVKDLVVSTPTGDVKACGSALDAEDSIAKKQ